MTAAEKREVRRLHNRVMLAYASLIVALVAFVAVKASWTEGGFTAEAHAKAGAAQAAAKSAAHK
jgi:hypothetical protein